MSMQSKQQLVIIENDRPLATSYSTVALIQDPHRQQPNHLRLSLTDLERSTLVASPHSQLAIGFKVGMKWKFIPSIFKIHVIDSYI